MNCRFNELFLYSLRIRKVECVLLQAELLTELCALPLLAEFGNSLSSVMVLWKVIFDAHCIRSLLLKLKAFLLILSLIMPSNFFPQNLYAKF